MPRMTDTPYDCAMALGKQELARQVVEANAEIERLHKVEDAMVLHSKNLSDEINKLRLQLVSARSDAIEECAKVAEQYPSSGAATEYPVEHWIRKLI